MVQVHKNINPNRSAREGVLEAIACEHIPKLKGTSTDHTPPRITMLPLTNAELWFVSSVVGFFLIKINYQIGG